jgi:hypothetical protein
MSGYEVVHVTQQFQVLPEPSVNTGFGSVTCPAGKHVVSGGYSIEADPMYPMGEVVVTASYPDGSSGWKVNFDNVGKGVAGFTAELYAVCVYVK